ncbi:MAG: DUF3261 domain-containing protein [Alphaproteobacteria bacterium]|nr:DUF3261 domain-containing protein [Alphaproteobacteria bacterium]
MMRWGWVIMLSVVASACAGRPPATATPVEPLRLFSLAPASLGRSLSLSQLVVGEYKDQSYKMRYEVDITPERLAMVGLSPLGITLFSLVQERDEISVETFFKQEPKFDPRYTLFDLYLTYWPPEVLRTALASRQMRFEESADGLTRHVRGPKGDILAEVVFPPKDAARSEIVIQHFDFPYRLRIVTPGTGGSR